MQKYGLKNVKKKHDTAKNKIFIFIYINIVQQIKFEYYRLS